MVGAGGDDDDATVAGYVMQGIDDHAGVGVFE